MKTDNYRKIAYQVIDLEIQALKKLLMNDALGKIHLCTARVRWSRDKDYYSAAPWRGTWLNDGGALINQGIHFIDHILTIKGKKNIDLEGWRSKITRKFQRVANTYLTDQSLRFYVGETGMDVVSLVLPPDYKKWYFDGEKMYEPLVLKESRIAAISSKHKDWKSKSEHGGAVFALCEQLLSTGMSENKDKFWMRIRSDKEAINSGSPKKFDIQMTPCLLYTSPSPRDLSTDRRPSSA